MKLSSKKMGHLLPDQVAQGPTWPWNFKHISSNLPTDEMISAVPALLHFSRCLQLFVVWHRACTPHALEFWRASLLLLSCNILKYSFSTQELPRIISHVLLCYFQQQCFIGQYMQEWLMSSVIFMHPEIRYALVCLHSSRKHELAMVE